MELQTPRPSPRYVFASVDSCPRVGGVSLLAWKLSEQLMQTASEGVYVGPAGTVFPVRQARFKVYEDFASEPTLRDGALVHFEDERIFDLFEKIVTGYSLNRFIFWHPFYYGPAGLLCARSRSLPAAVYIHGTEIASQFPNIDEMTDGDAANVEPNSLPGRLLEVLANTDLVFTNSNYTAELVTNLTPSARVVPVGCGIDSRDFETAQRRQPHYDPAAKSHARMTLGLPDQFTYICLGRLVPHKNTQAAIRAVAQIPGTQLLIVGDGPDKETLIGLTETLEASDRIFFLGAVSEEAKWRYLAASDVGLLLSTKDEKTGGYEGFGIALLEYAAAGCVPCTSGAHGMRDFAERSRAVTVCETGDVTANDVAILSDLRDDVGALNDAVVRARAVTTAMYTWEKVAERVRGALDNE